MTPAPILVVDDDPKIVTLVRTYLEREGFSVMTAADGRAALAAVTESEPRLIVLDIMLPELDGLALMRISVTPSGRLSATPPITAVGGNAFAFVFDPAGRLVIVNAAFGNLSTFTVNSNGSLTLVSAGASDGQAAACWVTAANGNYYAANAGSGSLSQFSIDANGTVALGQSPAATGIPGAVDSAASSDGHFLYAQSGGSGAVNAFAVNGDGSLSPLGSVTIPDGASQEGIAAA